MFLQCEGLTLLKTRVYDVLSLSNALRFAHLQNGTVAPGCFRDWSHSCCFEKEGVCLHSSFTFCVVETSASAFPHAGDPPSAWATAAPSFLWGQWEALDLLRRKGKRNGFLRKELSVLENSRQNSYYLLRRKNLWITAALVYRKPEKVDKYVCDARMRNKGRGRWIGEGA